MKKFAFLLLAAALLTGFTACSDDKENENSQTTTTEDGGGSGEGGGGGAGAKTPLAQKQYMEQVGKELMQLTPSSDFQQISELANHVADNYMESYDWDSVEEWAETCFDDACTFINTEKETDTGNGYGWTSIYNYFYNNYKSLLMASNFTGHFTAQNGKWVQTPASDLQFIFKGKTGQKCVLKLETSGAVKKVHVGEIEEWDGYEYTYSESDQTSTSNNYYNYYDMTIGVPEHIAVTLTEGSNTICNTTVNVDLNSLTGTEFDISKGNFTVDATMELNNGYKFTVSKVAYSANSKASVVGEATKNGTKLCTLAAAADVSGLPSCYLSTLVSDEADEDDFDNATGKNCHAVVDLMGKIQLIGDLSDVVKFVDYLEQADENDENESQFKSYVNQANSLLQFYLYFDNTNTKQAKVDLESFRDEYYNYWNGTTTYYWYCEPVIRFFDGTAYSTFEAYFNETDFKSLINTFNDLLDNYEDLIE